MDEIYTCTCGSQTWIIGEGKITCDSCGKDYELMWMEGERCELETPSEFNERIRKED